MRSEQQSRYCEVGSFRAHERDQRQTEVKNEKFLSAEWGRYYMEGMWINHTAQNTDAGRESKNKSISTVMGLTSTGLLMYWLMCDLSYTEQDVQASVT